MNLTTYNKILQTALKFIFALFITYSGLSVVTIERAEAVTWWHTAEYCNDSDGNVTCQTYSLYTATVNTDKTTYSPGETINLSASTHNPQCNNFTISYSLTTTLNGATSALGSGAFNGGQTMYHSGTRTAPAAPGSYNITATYCALWPDQWNCSTRTIPITVTQAPPPASATVSGTGCQIATNANSCAGAATWNISNASSPNLYNSNGTTYSNSAAGTGVPVTLAFGANTVSARNGSTVLNSATITATCEPDISWNGNSCAAPSATISGNTCSIGTLGDSSCAGSATWNISNATLPNVYNSNGTTYSISSSATNESINLPYGVNTIYARNGTENLASINLNVTCSQLLVWNGNACSNPPPPSPQIQIGVDKELIPNGGTVVTTSEVMSLYPVSCTIYGVESSPITFMHTPTATSTSAIYTHTSRPLTAAQIVSLSCEPDPAISGVPTVTSETRIRVVPTMQET